MAGAAGRNIGRYVLFDEIASGGMASVHLGRLIGPVGFARTVAIKRLHSHFARDPQFVSMFLDEARLAARIHHPNVVLTLDVVALEGEAFLVLEHVQGQSLAKLCRAAAVRREIIPTEVAIGIITGMLNGLHAAHEARGEHGEPLEIVHRDVSPQNVLVGVDGVARVLDFGVAKAANRLHESTGQGRLKGKLAYMAPEQVTGGRVDRRTDVFAASVVAWEVLTGRRLFAAEEPATTVSLLMHSVVPPPSSMNPSLSPEIDAIVLHGLVRDPTHRFQTAEDMSTALERVGRLATPREIGVWVRELAADAILERANQLAQVEGMTPSGAGADPSPQPVPSATSAHVAEQDQSGSQRRSNLTDVSFATPPTSPGRSAFRWAVGIIVALALLAGGVVLGTRIASRTGTPASVATSAPAPQPTPSASAPESAAATPPSAPSAEPSAAPSSEPSAAPVASPVVTAKPRATSKPEPAPKKPGCASMPKSCNPPWTIDASGGKRFKPECAEYLKCL